jgi:hypothetical protein
MIRRQQSLNKVNIHVILVAFEPQIITRVLAAGRRGRIELPVTLADKLPCFRVGAIGEYLGLDAEDYPAR